MTFTSPEFWLFFAVVLGVRHWTRSLSTEAWVLLVASYVFYLNSGVIALLVIVAMSAVDFHVGRRIGSSLDATTRKRWLWVSLATNLGVLAFFKYANFFLDNVNAGFTILGTPLSIPHADILVPIGISYVTFSGISYVLDVYNERVEPSERAAEYLLYIAYFPKILAGPIMRAPDFLEQFRERARATVADVEIGCAYFLLGAVKKLVIADQMAPHVSLIFASPSQYDAMTLLQGLIGYTVQIYCDFSGYSDMAIGCARFMGIRLPENFLMPYSAVSITEFWRRWHVTLSNWFRDYVFLPMEFGMRSVRNPVARVSFNILVTMLLCGLWHGASWSFVAWGGLHGAAMAAHRVWRAWRPLNPRNTHSFQFLRTLGSRALTLGVVMIGWVFFKAATWSLAVEYLHGLVTWRQGVRLDSPYILPLSVVVVVTHLLVSKDRNWAQEIAERPMPLRVAVYATGVLVLSLLVPADPVPFVYFQF